MLSAVDSLHWVSDGQQERRSPRKSKEEDKDGRNRRIRAMLERPGLRGGEKWEDSFQEQRERAEPPAVAVM